MSSRRHGVVGVIFREERLLIIRSSLTVAAPGKLCLPGGGIEMGETESQALVREMPDGLAQSLEGIGGHEDDGEIDRAHVSRVWVRFWRWNSSAARMT